MKVLLVNPWIVDFKLYDEWMHPTGLYFLYDLLIKNGHSVSYINCMHQAGDSKNNSTGYFNRTPVQNPPALFSNIEKAYNRYGISEENFKHRLNSFETPDLIMMTSGMTYWIDGLIKTADLLSTQFPGRPIIIGGISAQLIGEHLQKEIPNTTLFSQSLFQTGPITLHPTLTVTGYGFNLSLTSIVKEIRTLPHAPVLTTLGCPLRCGYCASSILQNKIHLRSTDTLITEIDEFYRAYGTTDYSFYDDALLFNAESRLVPLLDELYKQELPIRMHTPNGLHIKWITKTIAEKMKRASFSTLRFGYESGSNRFEETTGKKTHQQELAKKTEILIGAGFDPKQIGIYVMGGLPDLSPTEMYEEIDFILSLGVKAKPVFLSPVPKTQLYQHFAERYPIITQNPRAQNDTYFTPLLDGWSQETITAIKLYCRKEGEKL